VSAAAETVITAPSLRPVLELVLPKRS
jgi:hypothetical protein